MPRQIRVHALALVGYAAVTVLFNWPLPQLLGSTLTGRITGDTGVYVWNLWQFRHAIVAHGRFPLFTHDILSLTAPVDLSLHNYTLFADLLAFPLLPVLGVTATFNVIYLALVTMTAWAMFVLARAVIGRDAEAWLTGLLFGLSPVLVARSTGHFSLVAAAPLPLFVFWLMRAERRCEFRDAAAAGATVAWASMCDPYYGVFCCVIAASYLTFRRVRVRIGNKSATPRLAYVRIVDILMICLAGLIAGIAMTGGTRVRVLRYHIAMQSLYTPVLLLTLLALARLWLVIRPQVAVRLTPPLRVAFRFALVTATACVVPLSPVLYALSYRLRDGGALHGPVYWRSSPAGVDLLALFAPNPNHRLFGMPWRAWLITGPGGYVENVASLTIAGVLIVAYAVWRYGFRPSRVWLALTVLFAALALGPFVHIAGVNTYVPGPWAVLRYVPVIGATRTPARYAVVAMMMFSLLVGLALAHITAQVPRRRWALLVGLGLALAFELAPFPRRTYSAQIPDVYRIIAADPRDVRLLQLPFGIRDGERSEGNFSAAYQFYQTVHEKRLIGGYLSRISDREMARQRESPTVRGLMRLSEGRVLADDRIAILKQRAPGFLARARIGYVIIDSNRTPPALREFALDAFHLVKIAESDGIELYVPAITPPA